MQISVRSNIKEVTKGLSALEKKYIPNATRNAINDTLFGLRKELPKEMRRVFDEPVAFTLQPSAWLVNKAGKSDLRGEILLKRAQTTYLRFQVHGGTQLPRGKGIPIPLPKQRAMHGGLKRNWKSILDKKNYFSGKPKGIPNARPGIYKRDKVTKKNPGGKGLQLQVEWEKRTEYKERFDFYGFSQRYVRRHFARNFREKLRWYAQNRK